MDKVQITIVGAGVVGLAVAAELSRGGREVVLIEKEDSFGQGASSRNSEIIHTGIYYEKDSLKARLCLEGRRLLYEFCEKNNIPHRRIGKIIVAANEEEVKQLADLEKKAKDNGVEAISWMDKEQARAFEPAVSAFCALYSPGTGIVDSHSLMKCLENTAKSCGAIIAYQSELTGVKKKDGGYALEVNGEEGFETEILINSAGLYSDKIAALAGMDVEKNKYRLHYCKGEYFSYQKASFLKHLVYPVPEHDITGLGVHSVIDMAGALKFGPNAFYVDDIDYRVDASHRRKFWESVRLLFPQVEEADLAPDQAGIRPKLQGPGEKVRDFVIKNEAERGFPGLIDLIGIESPGLTACLAIAKYVSRLALN